MAKGNKLKDAREKLGLTQTEVAEKAGIHVNFYARLERGEEKPSITTVEKLSKLLKISSTDILGF